MDRKVTFFRTETVPYRKWKLQSDVEPFDMYME